MSDIKLICPLCGSTEITENKKAAYCKLCAIKMVEQNTSDTYEDDDCEYDDREDDDYDDDDWDDYDWCYECTGLGDDYYVNEDGTLECRCDNCMHNQHGGYNE